MFARVILLSPVILDLSLAPIKYNRQLLLSTIITHYFFNLIQ